MSMSLILVVMIGIIYKFTIIAKYKFNEQKPFYIGQHWECNSIEYFLSVRGYYGAGILWWEFLNKIKKEYPGKWKYFIKKEILFIISTNSQTALDKLEEYYIKKENSHYEKKLGGCNILFGTANKFGQGSISKHKIVRDKISKSRKGKCSGDKHPCWGTHLSDETKKRMSETLTGMFSGEKHWNYGKHHSEETRKKISDKNKGKQFWLGKHHTSETKERLRKYNLGKHHSEDVKNKMSTDRIGDKNPNYGHKWTPEMKDKISNINNGRKMSNETRLKMSKSKKGKIGAECPNFGTFWITDGIKSKKCSDFNNIPAGWRKGRTIKL